MKNILHIISSARGSQSYSRGLSSAIVEKLVSNGFVKNVVERDLTIEFPPLLNNKMVDEFYKHPTAINEEGSLLLGYSNTIYGEIKNADIIVIGTPMHNLGISASLKAWIDQLVRFGITYGYASNGERTGLLKNKKIYLAIASGGKLSDWPEGNEYIESYIKAVFAAYTGITDICTFRIEGTAQHSFTADYEELIESI